MKNLTPILTLLAALLLTACSGGNSSSSGSGGSTKPTIGCFANLSKWEENHLIAIKAGPAADAKFHRKHGYRRVAKNGIQACYPNAPVKPCVKSCGTPH